LALLTSIGAIVAQSRISDQDDSTLDAMAMVGELRDDNTSFVAALRAAKAAATAAGDNATEGMIDDWTDQAEQRVWFCPRLFHSGWARWQTATITVGQSYLIRL
jgi:starvation-inducible DNA-binding protein